MASGSVLPREGLGAKINSLARMPLKLPKLGVGRGDSWFVLDSRL